MSLLNSGSKRSSQPVFPYAVIPEKKSFWVRNRRALIGLALFVVVLGGVAVALVTVGA